MCYFRSTTETTQPLCTIGLYTYIHNRRRLSPTFSCNTKHRSISNVTNTPLPWRIFFQTAIFLSVHTEFIKLTALTSDIRCMYNEIHAAGGRVALSRMRKFSSQLWKCQLHHSRGMQVNIVNIKHNLYKLRPISGRKYRNIMCSNHAFLPTQRLVFYCHINTDRNVEKLSFRKCCVHIHMGHA